jgi:hypothetical protein
MREGRRSSERRFFCALLTLRVELTREFRRATLLRELLPASTSARILPSSDAWPFGDETPSLKDGMLRLFRFGGAGSGIPV